MYEIAYTKKFEDNFDSICEKVNDNERKPKKTVMNTNLSEGISYYSSDCNRFLHTKSHNLMNRKVIAIA